MSTTTTAKVAGGVANWTDERVGASKGVKFLARKIFPDHWSFMLGEVALYSFIILLLTGTFLTFFYIPSAGIVTFEHTMYNQRNQLVCRCLRTALVKRRSPKKK